VNKIKLGHLIEGIRKRDHKILTDIYRQYYPIVLGYIIRHGGDEAEAKDVFQESIIVIFKYSQEDKLDIREDFGSFLMGIAKRIWLKHLRRISTHERYLDQAEFENSEVHPSDQELEYETEMSLLRKHIVKLGRECQKVLMLVAEGFKNEEIAEKMEYKSEKTVRTKKYKCKETLIKYIKDDPAYRNGKEIL
jgi:RNA polymerase sigma factor (sigma-70 family)